MKKGNRKNAIVARPGKKETGSKKTSFQSSFPHASMPNNAPRFFTTQRINWGKMSITGKWHLPMVKRKQQNFIQTWKLPYMETLCAMQNSRNHIGLVVCDVIHRVSYKLLLHTTDSTDKYVIHIFKKCWLV